MSTEMFDILLGTGIILLFITLSVLLYLEYWVFRQRFDEIQELYNSNDYWKFRADKTTTSEEINKVIKEYRRVYDDIRSCDEFADEYEEVLLYLLLKRDLIESSEKGII